MSYRLKVETSRLEDQKEGLKTGFYSIHNGLVNMEKALSDLSSKGFEGESAESLTNLVNIIMSDVVAPSDRYNDLVLSNLNAAFLVFKEL